MASERIPSFVAFKGPNNKYLGYSKNGEYRGHLKFCYDDLRSPFVKHEIVEAPNGYAHIKCCYNNRYWRNLEDVGWIVAGEYSPNNDLSSQSCTLFDLKYEDAASNTVSLRLLQNKYVVYKEPGGDSELAGYPFAGEDKLDKNGSFILYDVGSYVTLPKFVAFKGYNGRFLAPQMYEGTALLQFISSDVGDNSIRHQVELSIEDHVHIKSLGHGTYWRMGEYWKSGEWITLEDSYLATFQPIKIDSQTVALKSVFNGICRSLTADGKIDCLSSSGTSLEKVTFFTVVEPVVSRKVHSIVYDIDSAHIYDLEPLALAKGSATNKATQPATLEIGLDYTERTTKSWSNSNSFKAGISVTFTAGVPLVSSAEIEVSAEDTFTWEWGKEEEQSTTISTKYTVVVGVGKTVEVVLQATRAKCDVKFSYVQEDQLANGDTVTITSEDGVFQGMNYTDVRFISNES